MSWRGHFVLDSFALLSFLEGEAGQTDVQELFAAAQAGNASLWMSVINYGEVVYITERERGLVAAHRAIAIMDNLPIAIVDADRSLTLEAAHFKARYRMSYADTFAAALAARKAASVVTGDPEFEHIQDEIPICWVEGSP